MMTTSDVVNVKYVGISRPSSPIMSGYRSDIVDESLILAALKSFENTSDVQVKVIKSDNATLKGENFIGDLASVEIEAEVKGRHETYHWMVKMLKPDNRGFNLGRLLGLFEGEVAVYKVRPGRKVARVSKNNVANFRPFFHH